MKQPDKNEITNRVNDAILGKICREDVGKWAMEYIRNDSEIEIMDIDAWHYLVAISNIDEMISPDDYLYTEDDIMSIIEYYEGRLIR